MGGGRVGGEEGGEDMDAEVAHRRALEGLRGQTVVGREAERADIGGHVGDAQRSRQVAEELEEPRPVGLFHDVHGAHPQ